VLVLKCLRGGFFFGGRGRRKTEISVRIKEKQILGGREARRIKGTREKGRRAS